jgi:hypothetical protein
MVIGKNFYKMDTPLVRSILEKNQPDQDYKILSDNTELGAWLQRLGACSVIVRHFSACATDEEATIQYGTYLGVEGLRRAHTDYPQVVDAGFVTIGFGEDGDLIVLDLFTGAVGLISHETIAEGCERDDFEFVADSLSEFIQHDDEDDGETDAGDETPA